MDQNENKGEDSFLKIATIWSEAEGNTGHVTVKEEIVSDVEPECVLSIENENTNDSSFPCKSMENQKPENVFPGEKVMFIEKTKKIIEGLQLQDAKLSCLHNSKNFKIVKRRLRCGDCRTLICPECCKVMTTTLHSHFSGVEMNKLSIYACKLCHLVFYSLCALQAHIRIHLMSTPYVCPDCGLIYNNIYFLILHLINKCFHVYKTVRFKCKGCPGSYFEAENLSAHIQENHLTFLYRCSICNESFNESDKFNFHKNEFHKNDKAYCLSYFRCSLCSNMVLPKFIFDRHINQHRNGPEAYEIEYQCVCGYMYGLVGSFRAHIQNCHKRGDLPPQWNFLKKNIRVETQLEISRNKNEIVNCESKNNKINLTQSCRRTFEEVDVEKSLNSGNLGKSSDVKDPKNKNEACEIFSSKIISDLKNSTLSKTADLNSSVGHHSTTGDDLNGAAGKETSEKPGSSDAPAATIDRENQVNGNEDDNCCKVQYDHIPCDHLGYVTKPSGGEMRKESPTMEVSAKVPPGFHTVTELDDRTGIITTKNVSGNELEEEVKNAVCEEGSPFHKNGDKVKSKVGSSLFKCPFCIISFPKQPPTFQQFKFHIDSYHPNAGLDVILNEDESQKNKKVQSVPESNAVMIIENKEDSAKVVSENTSLANEEEENLSKETTEQNKTAEGEFSKEVTKKTNDEIIKKHSKKSNEKKMISADEKEKSENTETVPAQNPCWTISVSLEKKETANTEKPTEENKTSSANSPNNSKKLDFKEFQLNKCFVVIENNSIVNEAKMKNLTQKQQNSNENESNTTGNKAETSSDENVKSKKDPSPEKEKETTAPDFQDELEISKDMTLHRVENPVEDSKEVIIESKLEVKEKSKKEGEVWSEFYESLMIAEKLKKRKEKKLLLEEKNKSLLSDYKSKRIVKKPKRYGESSDSEESGAEYDSCDSFAEVLLPNDNPNVVEAETTNETEVEDPLFRKKQKLFKKLRNADNKFLDYLFDLVNQKQRVEMYKKHSESALRYRQDLRNYRKKVMNGIKHGGQAQKMFRYQELLKKKSVQTPATDENAISNVQKKSPESGETAKPTERKRGRPRKIENMSKVKERRRSNKEADFIEKNFKDKIENSPSKRKRKLSSKLQFYKRINLVEEKDDFSSGQVITNKPVDSNKKFVCAVCKEAFPEITDFREHILVHRMEENSYQCMECGECFVVKPSLEKHLHAFHKIKNIEKYITENGCSSGNKDPPGGTFEPLKENQCKVCKDQFDRAIDLTKHFRIHGMAFLKEFKKDGKTK